MTLRNKIGALLITAALGAGGGATYHTIQNKPAPEEVVLLNGLGMYSGYGPMGPIADALKAQGYKVTILNHTDGKRLDHISPVMGGHSMGGNAVLKAVDRLIAAGHKPPRIIVTIDPGRAPLFHRCPEHVRCVNLYDPSHPIGGQYVADTCENYIQRGTIHGGMPTFEKVMKAFIRTVNERDSKVKDC